MILPEPINIRIDHSPCYPRLFTLSSLSAIFSDLILQISHLRPLRKPDIVLWHKSLIKPGIIADREKRQLSGRG